MYGGSQVDKLLYFDSPNRSFIFYEEFLISYFYYFFQI